MDGLFLNYSYFARLGHAVPSICVIAVHKITERDAGHWSTSADARNQPAQMGEHLATNHAAQMRCLPESRQGRLGFQIAAPCAVGQLERRIGPPTIEGGGAFVAAANRGPAGAGITTEADRLLRRGIALETKSYAATALYTTLVSLQNESSRMRGANPSLFRYFLKEWPFASYCWPLALRGPPPAGFA